MTNASGAIVMRQQMIKIVECFWDYRIIASYYIKMAGVFLYNW